MEIHDAELIQRTLAGDQTAFTTLVEKYYKGIHALAWRKIEDFHIAEEITQDTFLRAYERLKTLKDPSLFAGWIYVIATHLCTEWHRKKRLPMQSLEATNPIELEEVAHIQYMIQKRDAEIAETRREIVQKLLQKLPESERTVMTLHYLGEMTCETISKLLGVSPNTVKSRLSRARNRLREEEELLQKNLSGFQHSPRLVENIMRRISQHKPTDAVPSKPLLPWGLSVTSAILVLLLMGIGVQYLLLARQPYDVNPESALAVEIIDAPTRFVNEIKPALRNSPGNTDIPNKSRGTGEKTDLPEKAQLTEVVPILETEPPRPRDRWSQLDSPEAAKVNTLFKTDANDLYAVTQTGLYRLTSNNKEWHLINSGLPITPHHRMPMAEHNGTTYIVTDDAILTSKDKGETWKPLGHRPKGHPIELIVRENTHNVIELYLALIPGVFRSDDGGNSWKLMDNGMEDRRIYVLASHQNTLFAGTDSGLFRLNLNPIAENRDVWEQLPVAESKSIHSFAVSGTQLYVVAGHIRILSDMNLTNAIKAAMKKKSLWTVFRSADQGNSWTDITPGDDFQNRVGQVNLKIVAVEKTVLLIGIGYTLRSTDAGKTWIPIDKETSLGRSSGQKVVATLKVESSSESANQQQPTDVKYQFYIGDSNGIRLSTDSGNSWKQFNTGLGGKIHNLTVFNNNLYAIANSQLITSTDGGQSWEAIFVELGGTHITLKDKKIPLTKANVRQITDADGILYAKGDIGLELRLFRLDEENRVLIPIQGVPTLGERNPIVAFMKMLQTSMADDAENAANNLQWKFLSMGADIFGAFAISGNTFYVEHKRKLLIWHVSSQTNNDIEWSDTNIADTRDLADLASFNSFKLAVSGDTAYVGKPDGILLRSVDGGTSWETVPLPMPIDSFKQILIANATVYVATDKGAFHSSDGINWHPIIDSEGRHLIMDCFATDRTTLYAMATSKYEKGGVYRLTSTDTTWKRIASGTPDNVNSIAVADGTVYVGTESSGLQRIALDDLSGKGNLKHAAIGLQKRDTGQVELETD